MEVKMLKSVLEAVYINTNYKDRISQNFVRICKLSKITLHITKKKREGT